MGTHYFVQEREGKGRHRSADRARHIPGAGAGRTPPEGGGESELSSLKSSSPPLATIVEQLSDESVPATSRETVRRNKAFPVICIAVRLRSCRQYTDLCCSALYTGNCYLGCATPCQSRAILPRIVYTFMSPTFIGNLLWSGLKKELLYTTFFVFRITTKSSFCFALFVFFPRGPGKGVGQRTMTTLRMRSCAYTLLSP